MDEVTKGSTIGPANERSLLLKNQRNQKSAFGN
jgi:hypothetical protein